MQWDLELQWDWNTTQQKIMGHTHRDSDARITTIGFNASQSHQLLAVKEANKANFNILHADNPIRVASYLLADKT